jgi:hypothetical protein
MTFRAPSSDVRPFRPRCISSSNALKAAPETPSSRTDLQAWYRCAARDQQATYSSACLWDHSSLPIGKARCLGWFRKITFKGAAIVGPNLYIRPGIDRAFAVAGPRAGWPRNRSLLIGLGSRRRSASQAIDLPADGGVTLGRLITRKPREHLEHLGNLRDLASTARAGVSEAHCPEVLKSVNTPLGALMSPQV